jgi:hypothetical protein
MTSYYVWFIIFFCIAYLIITDQSIARAFYMLTQLARVQYEKTKWWIAHNPANPIVKYLMWRRALRTAKELEQEFAKRQKDSV